MRINKKLLFNWLKILLIIYGAIGIALYYLQEVFLFHPAKLPSQYQYTFAQKYTEVNIAVNTTDTINLIQFKPADSIPKGIIIYYHGNKNNIAHYANYIAPFLLKGYEVWMQDYPGFGKSTGTITEAKLYSQAMQIKKLADAIYLPNQIVLYGKSLGTGIAAYVASQSQAKLLLLETPYYSIPSLFNQYACIYPTKAMAKYIIPTHTFIATVAYPIIIFHGTSDGVIPYKEAQKLLPILKPTDAFITVPNGTHHNINSSKIYYKSIDSLLP